MPVKPQISFSRERPPGRPGSPAHIPSNPMYPLTNEDEYIVAERGFPLCVVSAEKGNAKSMEKTVWKLTLAYDGTGFHGWQVQLNCSTTPTIQAALADAIATVTGEWVLPQGSGRTDAGVHASGQVASFSLAAPIPPANFRRALNRILPPSIRVLTAEHASADFHARHSAVGKIYRYRIFHGAICPPFLARYVTCTHWSLDLGAMQQAALAILGEHDFTSFAAVDPDRTAGLQQDSQNPEAPSNLRRIDQSHWSCESAEFPDDDGTNAQIFTYVVHGNGFLHHMVRNLVGTFIEVGRGRIAPTMMADILTGRDRALAGPTAPASGLCLMRVLY